MKFNRLMYPVAAASLLTPAACAETAKDVTLKQLEWEAPSHVEQTTTVQRATICHPSQLDDYNYGWSGSCDVPDEAFDIRRRGEYGCVDIELDWGEMQTLEDEWYCEDETTVDADGNIVGTQERGVAYEYTYNIDEVKVIANCASRSRELKPHPSDQALARLAVSRCNDFGGADSLPRTEIVHDGVKYLAVFDMGNGKTMELKVDENEWNSLPAGETLNIKYDDGGLECFATGGSDC